jgi:hypothetical protein
MWAWLAELWGESAAEGAATSAAEGAATDAAAGAAEGAAADAAAGSVAEGSVADIAAGSAEAGATGESASVTGQQVADAGAKKTAEAQSVAASTPGGLDVAKNVVELPTDIGVIAGKPSAPLEKTFEMDSTVASAKSPESLAVKPTKEQGLYRPDNPASFAAEGDTAKQVDVFGGENIGGKVQATVAKAEPSVADYIKEAAKNYAKNKILKPIATKIDMVSDELNMFGDESGTRAGNKLQQFSDWVAGDKRKKSIYEMTR